MLKTRIFILALLIICTAKLAQAQITGARMQLIGLNCALCAKTTERALRQLPFVGDVKPDLSHNVYVISFKPGLTVDFDQINRIVRDENFFITYFKATVDLDQVKLDNNA